MSRSIYHLICIIFLFYLFLFVVCSADTIYLKDGKIVSGTIIDEASDKLLVDVGNAIVGFSKDQIMRYEYDDITIINKQIKEIKKFLEINNVDQAKSVLDRINLDKCSSEQKVQVNEIADKISEALKKRIEDQTSLSPKDIENLFNNNSLLKQFNNRESVITIFNLSERIISFPDLYYSNDSKKLFNLCLSSLNNPNNPIVQVEAFLRMAICFKGYEKDLFPEIEIWKNNWLPKFERMYKDVKIGRINKLDPDYILISSLLIKWMIENLDYPHNQIYKKVFNELFENGDNRLFSIAIYSEDYEDRDYWATIADVSVFFEVQNLYCYLNKKDFEQAFLSACKISCLVQEINFNEYKKFPFIQSTLRASKIDAREIFKNYRSLRDTSVLSIISNIPHEERDRFILFSLNKFLDKNLNDEKVIKMINEKLEQVIDNIKEDLKSDEDPQNLEKQLDVFIFEVPCIKNYNLLNSKIESTRSVLKKESNARLMLNDYSKKFEQIKNSNECVKLIGEIEEKSDVFSGTHIETAYFDLKKNLVIKLEKLRTEEKLREEKEAEEKAKQEKIRLEEENRKECEKINSIVNNFLDSQNDYYQLIKYWNPDFIKNAKQIDNLKSYNIKNTLKEDDSAKVTVYLEFTNKDGIEFKGDFTFKLIKRNGNWFINDLSE